MLADGTRIPLLWELQDVERSVNELAEAVGKPAPAVSQHLAKEFDELIGEIQPFQGAHELLAEVKERGFRLVLASSGKTKHVETFLDLVDGKSLADAWTTSDDVEKRKPEPDIVSAALAKVEGASGIMVGDSIYDAQAAAKLNIPTLGVRAGGFSVGELQEAGVLQVFDSLVAFRYALDGTPLARASR